MVTLTTGIMFLVITHIQFWVRIFYEGRPCVRRKFEKHYTMWIILDRYNPKLNSTIGLMFCVDYEYQNYFSNSGDV
jgi:hypothetical protein